ncbi:hypothetical protein E2542_SST09577 [Spatholobus suberectus]|nr:hypothetical protein E2542_SST09577 [Spatholobus suberectus]
MMALKFLLLLPGHSPLPHLFLLPLSLSAALNFLVALINGSALRIGILVSGAGSIFYRAFLMLPLVKVAQIKPLSTLAV